MLPEISEAPRQKFRGKKRHFRKMLRKAGAFELHKSPWWNYWHYHADWEGWGNLRWTYRREGLRALALVFRRIAQKPPAEPFQLWIWLDGCDAGQDAVYLLSPNPHSPFPFAPETDWNDLRLMPLMRDWVSVDVGSSGWDAIQSDKLLPRWCLAPTANGQTPAFQIATTTLDVFSQVPQKTATRCPGVDLVIAC